MTTVRLLADAAPVQGTHPLLPYLGPDRRCAADSVGNWLPAALDELDYGVLLVTHVAEILYQNHAALSELCVGHPLQCEGRQLRARRPADAATLRDALNSACEKQLRRLVTLGEGAARIAVSVVPLEGGTAAGAHPPTLLVLGKRQVCEALSADGYARSHGLTGAETRVLAGLCAGSTPSRIAIDLGIAISTVRTHIGTIRVKTGAASIRGLVGQVSQLPPLRGTLRTSMTRNSPVAARSGEGRSSFITFAQAA